MRKLLLLILPLTTLSCGGLKDQLLLDGDFFPWEIENGSSSGSSNGEASTVVVDTHNPEDSLATVSFDRTISITFSTTGSATVSGDEHGVVSVNGNGVTVNNTADEKVRYELSGTTADGFFKLYSTNKQAVVLKGVNITNRSGAPINIQSHKRCFVVVEGNSSLTGGETIFEGVGRLSPTISGGTAVTLSGYTSSSRGPGGW